MEWSCPHRQQIQYGRLAMRLREGRDCGLLFMPMVKLVSEGCGVAGVEIVGVGGGCTS
jgi:hypothetical protein